MKIYDADPEYRDEFMTEDCDFCSKFRPTKVIDRELVGYSLWLNKRLMREFSEDIEFVKSFSQFKAGYPISWTEVSSNDGDVDRFVGRHYRVVELEEKFPPQNVYEDDIEIRRKSEWDTLAEEIGHLDASDKWEIFSIFQEVREVIDRAFKPNPKSFYYVVPVEGGGWSVESELNQHYLFGEFYENYADAIVAASCLAATKWTPNRWKSFRRTIPLYIIAILIFLTLIVLAVRFSG